MQSKVASLTSENTLLLKSKEDTDEVISKYKWIISNLKSKVKEISKEKAVIDKAAEELFERCQLYEGQCEQLMKQQDNMNQIISEIEAEWKDRLDSRDREATRDKKSLETKLATLKEENRGLQLELELVNSQIDVSEIRREEGVSKDMAEVIEALAKDVGYGYGCRGIEGVLEESEIQWSMEDAVKVVQRASAKIRELRELIENLSKKLWLSENNDNVVIKKLKLSIDKLKNENRKLTKEKSEFENTLSGHSNHIKIISNNFAGSENDTIKQKVFL